MNEYDQTPTTSAKDMRAIRILFNAIVAGAVMFSAIVLALSLVKETVSPIKEYENIILGIGIAVTLGCYIAARNGYNKGIAIAKDSLISLPDKLNQYRTTLILYLALCEGPALFGIILFFVTGNYFMFIITALMIAAMLVKAPTRRRVIDELALDWKQQEQLD